MLTAKPQAPIKALRPTVIAVLLGLASVPAVLSLSLPDVYVQARIVLNVLALLLLSAACLVIIAPRSQRWFGLRSLELGPWWVAYYALSFGLTSLGWANASARNASKLILPESIPLALFAALAGIGALTIGFVSGPMPLLTRALKRAVRWSTPGEQWTLRSTRMPLLIYAAGFCARLVRIFGHRYGYIGNTAQALSSPSSLNQLLAQIEQFTRYGIVLAALDALLLSRSAKARRLLVVLLLIETGFGIASGVKSELVMTLLAVGIPYAVIRGEVSRRAIVAVVLAMLFLVPLNLAYRKQIVIASSTGHSPVGEVLRLPSIALQAYSGESVSTTLSGSTVFASSRLREIDNLALIMQRSPSQIPFRSARELAIGPVTGLIPRALWPSKPLLSLGYQFSQEYYNLPIGFYTSSATTIPGDLYRHGGWWILLVGMALLGKVIRSVEVACSPIRDPRKLLFYVGLFLLLINLESDLVSLAVSLIEIIFLAAVLTRFSFLPRRDIRTT